MNKIKKIIIIIFCMTCISIIECQAYSNPKWGEGFYTENYVYFQDTLPYILFKDLYNNELGLVITNSEGQEILEKEYIYTGAQLQRKKNKELRYIFVILGDVDANGIVTAADARIVLRLAANLDEQSDYIQMLASDINSSYTIDAADARMILRYAAKIDNYEKFSSKKLSAYDYLDEAFVTIEVNGEYMLSKEIFLPEDFDAKLVKQVYVINENSDMNYKQLILELNEPGRDNVDELIFKLMGMDNVVVQLPCETDFN